MTRFALPFVLIASFAAAQSSPLARYRTAASSLSEAKAAVWSAQTGFATCINGRLQLAFAPALPKLEGARRGFEKSLEPLIDALASHAEKSRAQSTQSPAKDVSSR